MSVFNDVCEYLEMRRDMCRVDWIKESLSGLYVDYLEGEGTDFAAKLERAFKAELIDDVIDCHLFRDRLHYLSSLATM